MSPLTDAALVEAVLAGDLTRFREVVERHDARVRRIVASRLDDIATREDAVQETFYKAFKELDRLARPERLGAWLTRIARTVAADQGRRVARRETELLARMERAAPESAPLEWVWDEVRALSRDHTEVLRLRYREGKSYAEVAAALGVPLSTVRGRIYEARRALRRRLIDEEKSP